MKYKVPQNSNEITLSWVKSALHDLESSDPVSYKNNFSNIIQALIDTPRDALPSQETRIEIVRIMTEEYLNVMGEYPQNYDLEMLSNYVMLDYIKSVNKSKKDKISFHTAKQCQRRASREVLVNTNDTLVDFLYCRYQLNMDSMHKINSMEVEDKW